MRIFLKKEEKDVSSQISLEFVSTYRRSERTHLKLTKVSVFQKWIPSFKMNCKLDIVLDEHIEMKKVHLMKRACLIR